MSLQVYSLNNLAVSDVAGSNQTIRYRSEPPGLRTHIGELGRSSCALTPHETLPNKVQYNQTG